ncbi:BTAD domain-containing putative transcriptional regulator [Nocardia sp. GCM10030253]|uniref:AfsR/SARP family transcriptional regulator n=1 Tax=Nocardia sp. GCM10030253 TaxID=3273404 RepID=UPI00363470AA
MAGLIDVRFTVLGPVEVLVDGRALPAAPRHRAVLAWLLLNARRVYSNERLIDAIWGMEPPGTARSQIHAAVTAIRRVLREAGVAHVLETKAAGYVVAPEPGMLDLDEFTRRVAVAQTLTTQDPPAAVAELRAALSLWRGEALAGLNADYVASARLLLDEKRIAAFERLADIELSLGKHDQLLDELRAQVAAHPLREKLSAQLMLAMHRAGRQADALAIARAFRTELAEQQGLDPGSAFVALEQAVLRDDPATLAPDVPLSPNRAHALTAFATSGPATSRSTNYVPTLSEPTQSGPPLSGATQSGPSSYAPATPEPAMVEPTLPVALSSKANFLPYDIPDFAGRDAELDRLIGPLDDTTVTISAIDGMAGIGKTALAVHVAHRVAERFPDGQLFIDLQAHSANLEPIAADAALEILLRQLGIPEQSIPTSTVDRGALWRSELAGRRVVVVLDNAADTDHVRPLLPNASASLLLITSRRRLVDLDGARALSVDLLPADDAVGLFEQIVGARAIAEPLAVLDVLQLCGFLPLAVRIAAARLQHRPRWTVEYLAGRLRDERRRLAELSTAERGVAAAFALSYRQLEPEHQRMFRLLGLHPGRDFDPGAAAALANSSVDDAEMLLEDLLDAHVIAQHELGRYTFHELLREHARATGAEAETDDSRNTARTRLFDHYLHTARTAVDLLFHYSAQHRRPLPEPSRPVLPFIDDIAAGRWLDAEHENLLATAGYAAEHGLPTFARDAAEALRPYLDGHSRHTDAARLHTVGLSASRQLADRSGEARALTDLGWAHWRQGDFEQAFSRSTQALLVSREIGDHLQEARALNTLGNVAWRRRDYDEARRNLEPALQLAVDAGNQVGEAHVRGNLAMVFAATASYTDAEDHLDRALALHRELGNQRGEALVLNNLGVIARGSGQFGLSLAHHGRARDLYRMLGNHSDEASAVNALGETARCGNNPTQAITDHTAALDLADEASNLPEQARAQEGLSRAHHTLGHLDEARAHAESALELYTDLGVPEAEDMRTFLNSLP